MVECQPPINERNTEPPVEVGNQVSPAAPNLGSGHLDVVGDLPSFQEQMASANQLSPRVARGMHFKSATMSRLDTQKKGIVATSVCSDLLSPPHKVSNVVLVREDLHKYSLGSARGLYEMPLTTAALTLIHIGTYIRIPLHSSQYLRLCENGPETLHQGAKVLLRVSGPVYNLGTVIQVFNTRELSVLVQIKQGQCHLAQSRDVIAISNAFEERAKRLPIVGAEELCIKRAQKVLIAGNSLELVLGLALLALSRSADYSQKDDQMLFLAQKLSAILTVILVLFSFYFVVYMPRSFETRTQANLTVKALLLCFVDLFNLLYPSTGRLVVAVLGILTRFVQFTFILLTPRSQTIWAQHRVENTTVFEFLRNSAYYARQRSEPPSLELQNSQKRAAALFRETKWGWVKQSLQSIFREGFSFYLPETAVKPIKPATLGREKVFLDGKKSLQRLNRLSPVYFAAIGIGFILFIFSFMGLEFYRLITNQNTALTIADLDYMRNVLVATNLSSGSHWSVNNGSQSNLVGLGVGFPNMSNTNKVIFVLMDGLRYDHLDFNVDMKAVLKSTSYEDDAVLLPMRVQIPTMSVPNWATFLTGAAPWLSGIIGNAATSLVSLDSVFSIASTFNKTAGMSASAWFSDLVQSYLQLRGGAVSTNDASFAYQAPGLTNSAMADQQRLQAVTGNLDKSAMALNYDFFLVHFSDIDERGHAAGVTQKYNKDNTYYKAVSAKAKALEQLLKLVDNQTIVMMAADHGQVDSGGHGGASEVLQKTFLWIYQQGSNLKSQYPDVDGWNTPQSVRNPVNSVDVAPTILAMLGLPMPITSMGSPIPEVNSLVSGSEYSAALNYSAAQQQLLKYAYNERVYMRPRFPVKTLPSDVKVAAVSNWQADANQLRSVEAMQSTLHGSTVAGNVLVAVGYVIFVQFVLWVFSSYVTGIGRPTFINAGGKRELRSVAIGFLTVVLYLLCVVAVFMIYWTTQGKSMWDSTLIHHPNTIAANIAVFWIPGVVIEILAQFLMNGCCQLNFDRVQSKCDSFGLPSPASLKPCDKLKVKQKWGFLAKKQFRTWRDRLWLPRKSQLDMQDCAKIHFYAFYSIALFFLIGLICIASFSGMLKFQTSAMYISQDDWVFRFRIMSFMWMGLPCIVGKLVSLIGILRSLSHLPLHHLLGD